MLSNEQFFTQLGTLIEQFKAGTITGSAFKEALVDIAFQWSEAGTIDLYNRLSAFQTGQQVFLTQYRNWLGGTPTGGPNSDGWYPLTNDLGRTILAPCIALLTSTVTGPAAEVQAIGNAIQASAIIIQQQGNAVATAANSILTTNTIVTQARLDTIAARDITLSAVANVSTTANSLNTALADLNAKAVTIGNQANAVADMNATVDAMRAIVINARDQVVADRQFATDAAIAALGYRDTSLQYRDTTILHSGYAAANATTANSHRLAAANSATAANGTLVTITSLHSNVVSNHGNTVINAGAAAGSASSAYASMLAAQAAEANATTIVGGNYANVVHTHSASDITSGVFDIARIPVLPSQVQVVSSGDLTALTSPQQTSIGQGTIVTVTDGRRFVYSGTGSKTAEASYVVLADVTPDWSVISGKPSTFTPAAHTHGVADITNLSTTLSTYAPKLSPALGGNATIDGFAIWHAGNDGAGSTLDADLLDGQHGAYYSNATNLSSGTLPSERLPASVGQNIAFAANAVFNGPLSEFNSTLTKYNGPVEFNSTLVKFNNPAEFNSNVAINGTPSFNAPVSFSFLTTHNAGAVINSPTGLTVNGPAVITGNTTVTGWVRPASNTTQDIGASTARFANVYATTFQGNATASYFADLAERFEASEPLEPGQIVALGGDKEIAKATSGDVILGVISTNPGVRMNDGAGSDETHPFVAYTGRVPCLVAGPIAKRQAIVASDLPGVGRAAQPGEHDVVGYALEAKSSNDIEAILIVVR